MTDMTGMPRPGAIPRINEPAPDFRARSTTGEISLADYRGKWVVLFSHPADFTPVCTSEFAGLARMMADFEAEDTQLVGLSIDSIYSHIAWLRDIEANFGILVTFPVIADVDMHVSTLYGMVHPSDSDTSTVRALFVIDPEGVIRALIYYPLSTGRNLPEILRVVRALKTTAEHRVSTPANWQPGDPVIQPTPITLEGARDRQVGTPDAPDWYFALKNV